MENKTKKQLKYVIYPVLLFSVLISMNIYFFIFVHNFNDLSPNIAMIFVSFPFAIYELIRAFRNADKIKNQQIMEKIR